MLTGVNEITEPCFRKEIDGPTPISDKIFIRLIF